MASIHSLFFTCLSYRIKKRKKATTFKLIKLLKHTQKHAVTTEDRILIKHYRLDKSIEPENMPSNNPDLKHADYSLLENLSQRLYKHQKIGDMQHLENLLEKKGKNCHNTRVMYASISLDIVYLKLSKYQANTY